MKKCPFCAEEIQAEAKKCKHCWEFLADAVKTEKKAENKNWIGDFSRCRVLKENEWPANIRCPKCWFHGIAKEIRGDYNPTIFRVLFLFFPIVWGILYYLFTTKTRYVCPDCSNDYLEVLSQAAQEEIKNEKKKETDWKSIWIAIIIWFLGFILIVLLGGK